MHRAARVDRNQSEIVAGLRKLGCSVLITSQLKGCFDILVGIDGYNIAIEIKDGEKPKAQQKLTPMEEKFASSWLGNYAVASSLQEAIIVVEKIVGKNLELSKK